MVWVLGSASLVSFYLSPTGGTSDFVIHFLSRILGEIVSVAQGLANGTGDANKFTVYNSIGKSFLFTVTGKAKEWAEAVQKAITANPGGIMSIVQNSTGVKITALVIA